MTGPENAEPPQKSAQRHPSWWRPVASAAMVFALFVAVGEYAYRLSAAVSLREHRAQVAAAATRLHDAIEIELNATVHLATGLTAYLQVRKLIDQPAEVMAMLQNLVSYGRHIRNIAIAPGNRLSYVYPEKGNEKAIGLYYPDVPSQWPAIERTIRERKARLAGPLTLMQGGVGLVYRVPVFLEDGSYWGIISTVVDAERLFAAVGLTTNGQDVKYSLRGRDGLGAAGDVFFGEAGLFAQDAVVVNIDVPGGRWQLAAMPADGWRVSPQIVWLRYAGWLIAALLAFLLHQRLEGDRRRTLLAEARQASEERYRNLFTRSEVAMLLVDPASGEIVEANAAAVAFYGYPAEQLRSLRIFDINMLTAGEITAEMARAGREHRSHFHFVHRLASGELRDVEVRSGPIEVDGRQLLYSIVFDVTASHRVEEERRRLALAVEQSPSTIIITDPQGRIEYVNAAFCRTTGYTMEEAVGRNPRMLQSGETPEEVYTVMWQALAAGQAWHGVFRNRRKNGELFWEQVHISPVIDEMGVITHYLGIKEDITARIEAEAELVKAKEAAEAASRVKSQFLANMSHEIRTPMNGIIGMTHLLLETRLDDDQREFARIVRSSAESLLGIINDILDFSKVEAGRLEIGAEPVDPRALLRGVADLFAGQAAEKGLALEWTVADEVPAGIVGDAGRLRQVLVNLVGNAVKFTAGGTVQVTAGVA
ncbi:partial two-component system, NarL family, sensor histidine kinase EvgS, partial [Rhodocyclaceae bacterium]